VGRGRSGFLAARARAEAKALNLATVNPLARARGVLSAAFACVVPALVTGHVVRDGGTPVAGAHVRAFSGAGVGCESLDTDFGLVVTAADGGFRLGLASGILLERVCVLVFARPPAGVALGVSDTVLLVMDFRDELTPDSAQVELVLGAE
jgi:hypothetical protein